ncbi:MAG: hypothetical protein MUC63_00590 [Planctomycetes bacterium]|nr:hypothetical protein [Planctomycetota bacterium]
MIIPNPHSPVPNSRLRFLRIPLLLVLAAAAGCPPADDGSPSEPPPPFATSNAKPLNAVDPWGSGFPSDMALADSDALRGTLFVVDEASVDAAGGARVLALDLDAPGMPASAAFGGLHLLKTDLRHADGSGVGAGDTFGAFGVEAAAADLLMISPTSACLLASASHEGDPPFLANLFWFNPTNASLPQTLNLAIPTTPPTSSVRSDGSAVGTHTQSNPTGTAWVPSGGTAGKLYVSMSNLHGAAAMNAMVYNPGTVLAFNVDTGASPPVSLPPAATVRPGKWNPVQVTAYTSAATGKSWVLVSNAGVTQYYGTAASWGYSPPYQTASFTEASIEVIDPATDAVAATIPMGLAALSFNAIAIGKDGTGRTVGMIGSSFFGQVYAVDLSGLDENPMQPAKVRPLRSAYRPIPVFHSREGDAHTWACDVALAPNGRLAFVSAFNQAEVHAVECPEDWETGEFRARPEPFARPFEFEALDGGVPSVTKLAVRRGAFSGPDVLVLQSNAELAMPGTNLKFGSIGTIDTAGRTR